LKHQINFFSIEEAQKQQEEIQNYKNSLELKLNEEKSVFS